MECAEEQLLRVDELELQSDAIQAQSSSKQLRAVDDQRAGHPRNGRVAGDSTTHRCGLFASHLGGVARPLMSDPQEEWPRRSLVAADAA